jgi:hypothetical protein
MRSLAIIVLLFASLPSARAQGSPAFDPDCYLASATNPSETQVRYGTEDLQHFGGGLMNIGAAPGETSNRLFFIGLPPTPPFMTALRTGSTFNLNNPDIQGQSSFIPFPRDLNGGYSLIGRAHLHTHDRWDLIMSTRQGGYRIYWADSNGLYDSSSRVELFGKKMGSYLNLEGLYWDYLTSDTVEDLAILGTYDSQEIFLFRGGKDLYERKTWSDFLSEYYTIADTSATFAAASSNDSLAVADYAVPIQGDFRGVGRKDFVGFGPTYAFYYKNDKPFSLENFARAVREDTLCAYWQNPSFDYKRFSYPHAVLSMQAAPRTSSDASQDILVAYPSKDSNNAAIRVFRGGPDFGAQRISLDHPDYLLQHPSHFDFNFDNTTYFQWLQDCGDMTGTGNHVLYAPISNGSSALHLFYVLGNAIDDKIDMFIENESGSSADTLTANGDNLEDFALGLKNESDPSDPAHSQQGMVEVIYGSKKIPVRLNSVPTRKASDIQTIAVAPNPMIDHTVVTWQPFSATPFAVRLIDMLGRTVYEETRPSTGDYESFRLNVPHLHSGDYVLELVQESGSQRAKMLVID